MVHCEGDGISGLVVDRYGDLLVVEFFSAGTFRHREWIYDALQAQFPGCRFYSFADEHVQKQESFDFRGTEPVAAGGHHRVRREVPRRSRPARTRPASSPTSATTAQWLSQQVEGKRVLDLCCNTGGFAVYAGGARRRAKWSASTSTRT